VGVGDRPYSAGCLPVGKALPFISQLLPKEHMQYPPRFNEESRYIFTNWSDEDYTGTWNGISETVKAGEFKELPEYKAFHYCRHFVDREMQKAKVKDESIGIDSVRKPYEDKTIVKIGDGVDSPALATIKKQIAKQIKEDDKKESKEKPEEFSALKK